MGQYDYDECTLPACGIATEYGCDYLDTVNITWINLAICAPRFIVGYTIEDAPVCDAASSVDATMVSELRVHTIANVVELFMQTFVVLQTTPIPDSVLVMWLHDPLRPCG
ncbi:hypothetical protein TNCV_1099261 [Trichonephila clavipes]|nr:hypothetical protein TNCV_1099261 [Trichonephila clavipes]